MKTESSSGKFIKNLSFSQTRKLLTFFSGKQIKAFVSPMPFWGFAWYKEQETDEPKCVELSDIVISEEGANIKNFYNEKTNEHFPA